MPTTRPSATPLTSWKSKTASRKCRASSRSFSRPFRSETEKLDQTKIKLKNANNQAERDTLDIMEKQNRLKEVQGKLSELFKTMQIGNRETRPDQDQVEECQQPGRARHP